MLNQQIYHETENEINKTDLILKIVFLFMILAICFTFGLLPMYRYNYFKLEKPVKNQSDF